MNQPPEIKIIPVFAVSYVAGENDFDASCFFPANSRFKLIRHVI